MLPLKLDIKTEGTLRYLFNLGGFAVKNSAFALFQRLFNVLQDIIHMLQPDRYPD